METSHRNAAGKVSLCADEVKDSSNQMRKPTKIVDNVVFLPRE